jgi:hypothetical protein
LKINNSLPNNSSNRNLFSKKNSSNFKSLRKINLEKEKSIEELLKKNANENFKIFQSMKIDKNNYN